MIKQVTIKRLKSFDNSGFPILSAYLGADSVQAPPGELLLKQFHSLEHQNLDKELRAAFESDIARIEKYLSDYVPSARSLIFFSAGKRLWEVVELEYYLLDSLRVGDSPYLDPLTGSLGKYARYLVLLIDREKARMFTVEQGEIVDHADFMDKHIPQRAKATSSASGGSGDINFRHNEELLQQHVERAVKALEKFTTAHDVHFMIIGGHAEIFKKVMKSLPSSLRVKVAGTFVTEINIPLNDILLESKKIAAKIDLSAE